MKRNDDTKNLDGLAAQIGKALDDAVRENAASPGARVADFLRSGPLADFKLAEDEAIPYLKELISNQKAQIRELENQRDEAKKEAEKAARNANAAIIIALVSAIRTGLTFLSAIRPGLF
ncbi:MAG: hypothetical protein IJI97_08265 [Clostridia bacterium]|nr:hypothetical protein [Clostridia bacterium]